MSTLQSYATILEYLASHPVMVEELGGSDVTLARIAEHMSGAAS